LEFVGPIPGGPLFEAKARLAGSVTENDQLAFESSPNRQVDRPS
jgi:hypothetical protein